MIDKLKSWFFKPTQHFQIRYNTKVNNGDLVWRIIIDGKETLASHIYIHGYVYGESSLVNNERKMNIACDGKIYWRGTSAEIITTKAPDLLS
jgi:hypothetical protein